MQKMASITEMPICRSVPIDMDAIIQNLFRKSMYKKWDEVVKIYRENPMVHKAKITRSGNTALHIAVFDGEEDTVEELVRIIQDSNEADTPQQRVSKESEAKEVLKIENERRYTPLHLAALIGSVRMCDCIAKVDPSLVVARNHDGETPFFLAALYGKKEAFFCLHIYIPADTFLHCRRNDGDTILHGAIDGYFFDLAFQIIPLYPDLVNSVNERGFSPLHRLASKPSVFRSGCDLGIFYKIIYHCIVVGKLKPSSTEETNTLSDKTKGKYPENFRTCISFFGLFRKMVQVGIFLLQFTTKKEEKKEGEQQADAENPQAGFQDSNGAQGHRLIPANYETCFDIVKRIILGLGYGWIKRIRYHKKMHVWSVQIMSELLKGTSHWPPATSSTVDVKHLEDHEKQTQNNDVEGQKGKYRNIKKETPILIAAKNGVTEMVVKILEKFPEAIHDMNTDNKNIVLLAVENRQPHVYKFLIKSRILEDDTFQKVDNDGNCALHLAAKLGDKYWLIPGPALQMQMEMKWVEFVFDSAPNNERFIPLYGHLNSKGQSPWDIFAETHKDLLERGGKWLNDMSQSCSLVAGLLVTVAYNTSTTVPGGVTGNEGTPTLEHYTAFGHFAVWSLIAFYSSLSAVVMFLSILTSGYHLMDFQKAVFVKLLLGLTALYVSIAATLASFTAGHYFILKDKLKQSAAPVYTGTCLIVTLFAIAQFPIYIKLVWAMFKKVPDRSIENGLPYGG